MSLKKWKILKSKLHNFKKIIPSIVVVLVLLGLVFLVWLIFEINTLIDLKEANIFIIEKGQSVSRISQNLKDQNLVRSKRAFEIYVYFKKLEKKFQTGEYQFEGKINSKEIIKLLTSGGSNERTIKIIEGWTAKDIAQYLEEKRVVEKSSFLDKANCGCGIKLDQYDFLDDKPEDASLEGFLFPDTYRVYKDAIPRDIIYKMLDNFEQKLTKKMRDDIKASGRPIYEVITMASIIEAEVPHEEDRTIVSGILWKRLEAGVPLQTDSTLNYVTGRKSRALSAEELKIDSPYNTYMYPDLPPTPISNPGLSAIRAAIYPQDSEYWYFLSTLDGETIFSKTLDEHNQAKAKYLQ